MINAKIINSFKRKSLEYFCSKTPIVFDGTKDLKSQRQDVRQIEFIPLPLLEFFTGNRRSKGDIWTNERGYHCYEK